MIDLSITSEGMQETIYNLRSKLVGTNLVLCIHREGINSDDAAWFLNYTSLVLQHKQ